MPEPTRSEPADVGGEPPIREGAGDAAAFFTARCRATSIFA